MFLAVLEYLVAAVLQPLVFLEEVAGVDLLFYVIEVLVVAVGEDDLGLLLELGEVVDNFAAEEGGAVVEGGFVDDDSGAFGFDALHHALDAALAEVVTAALHCQAVNAYDALFFLVTAVVATVVIIIIARHAQNTVGYEVFTGAVALNDCLDEVLGHVGIVGKQLLGVFGKAIAAVAEAGIVVVRADAWIKAHAVDYRLGVKALHLGVGVELVEVAHSQGEVGVGEEFHRLGLGQAHEQGIDIGLECAFLQELGETMRSLVKALVALGTANDDAAGIEVVVQSLGLTKELRGKEDILGAGLLTN